MGRSINYLKNSEYIIYIHTEEGQIEEHWQWEDFEEGIIETIQNIAPSLHKPSDSRWEDKEVRIILCNNHAEVGISEYCGLVSLSFRICQDHYTNIHLAKHWVDQIEKKIKNVFNKRYQTIKKIGSFSNGEGIFESIK